MEDLVLSRPRAFLLFCFVQVTGWDGELEESDSLQEQCGMDSLQAVEFRRIICTQVMLYHCGFTEDGNALFLYFWGDATTDWERSKKT